MLLARGVHARRLQTAREYPDAQPGDAIAPLRSWTSERRHHDMPAGAAPSAGPNSSRIAELERLSMLHDTGSLTDAEFLAAKAALKNGS